MAKGTFQIISESYQRGANNLFNYCQEAPWILKPFLYIYALMGCVVLYVSSFAFYILIIFDHLASAVNCVRRGLLNAIEERSRNVEDSFIEFIFNPIIIALLTPIFILSALLPKISSELDIDEATGEILEKLDITSNGTFRKIMDYSKDTISNSLDYIKESSIIWWPFLILPWLFNSLLMLIIIVISTPLLLLDLFSYIIDSIRGFCIKISRNLGESTEESFGWFLFSPIILALLAPVFILVLIIPKFSTGIDASS